LLTGSISLRFTCALLLHLLLSHRYRGGTGETPPLARRLSVLGWLILGVIAITLISGYPTFAAFVASGLISILPVLGVLYLFVALGNAPTPWCLTKEPRAALPSSVMNSCRFS
jgi:hypothetical protein